LKPNPAAQVTLDDMVETFKPMKPAFKRMEPAYASAAKFELAPSATKPRSFPAPPENKHDDVPAVVKKAFELIARNEQARAHAATAVPSGAHNSGGVSTLLQRHQHKAWQAMQEIGQQQ